MGFSPNKSALKLGVCVSTAVISATILPVARAQEAATEGDAFEVPVFEQIDQNGVDLVSGQLRVMSPTFVTGTDEAKTILGLQWTGKAWSHIEWPTIWRRDNTYIVNYMGTSQEFKGRSDNYAEKKPITGAKLSCWIWEPGNVASDCIYTHRNGDVIQFRGRYSNITQYPPAYGTSTYAWGNLGMAEARLTSVDNRSRVWGQAVIGGFSNDSGWGSQTKSLGSLIIYTPNNDNENGEHYLRPRNTIQTITDIAGSQWKYTINDNRFMTKIDLPGNGADINISYNNGKVQTVSNANGTWNYSYGSTGNYKTTTVTNPLGQQTYVRHHEDKKYVVEHRDPLNRTTLYGYDSGDRLTSITYPEQNYVAFTYDARGNVTSKTLGPKPSIGGMPLVETASFPATCASAVTCNRPTHTVDARGNQTDFGYVPSTPTAITVRGSTTVNIDVGTGKPAVVTSPAPTAGAARPQIRNTYSGGVLTQSSICRTLSSCAGTADEMVTAYDYGGTEATTRNLYGIAVTSEGQTLRTCYDYNAFGRKVSETPPRADIGTCPKVTAPNPGLVPPTTPAGAPAPTFP